MKRSLAVALALLLLAPAVARGGALDPAFGGDGIVTSPFPPLGSLDVGLAIARQADGKLVVVGNSGGGFSFGSGGDFAVVRLNADGSPDTGFGGNGQVVTSFVADAAKADEAHAVAIQPTDQKIVVAGVADLGTGGTSGDFAVARYNTDGSLDTTFGGDGTVTTNIGHDDALAVAVAGDGKIVVAGDEGDDIAVVRYEADGDPDPTFGAGGDGIVTTPVGPGSNTDRAEAVAVQGDGKIVVAGVAYVQPSGFTDTDFALVRYESDGDLDPTFDTDGKVTTEIGNDDTFPWDEAHALALQPDGKIVLAGQAVFGGPGVCSCDTFALARYNANGSLDTTFGGDGRVATSVSPVGNTSVAHGVAVAGDGKIVAVGRATNARGGDFHSDFGVVRYMADGSLDTSFDLDGMSVRRIAPDPQIDIARGVVIQPADGKIVAAGYSETGPPEYVDFDFSVIRYLPNGDTSAPDTTITGGPADGSTTSNFEETFTFTSSEPNSTFRCAEDALPFVECSSPHTMAGLGEGPHTFAVRAFDEDNNSDPTPASRAFSGAGFTGFPGFPPPPPPAGGGPPPADLEGPVLKLGGARTQRVLRQGGVIVVLACLDEACTARARGSVRVPGAARTFRLRPATRSIAAGGEARLKLRLSRPALAAIRKALRKRRALSARVSVTATDDVGNATAGSRRIALRR